MVPRGQVCGPSLRRRAGSAVGLAIGLCLLAARAAAAPGAACAVAEMPRQFAGSAIRVGLWLGGFDDAAKLGCLDGGGRPPDVLTVAETSFLAPDGVEEILGRIGRISQYRSIRYWSHTRGRWRALIVEAYPVASLEGRRRDPVDIPVGRLTEGASFLLYQKENTPADEVIYRVTVERRRPGTLVVSAANAVEVGFLGLTVFAVGDYSFRHSFERGADGLWRYRGVVDERGGRSPLAAVYQLSFVNRLAALAAYLTGKKLADGSLRRVE